MLSLSNNYFPDGYVKNNANLEERDSLYPRSL